MLSEPRQHHRHTRAVSGRGYKVHGLQCFLARLTIESRGAVKDRFLCRHADSSRKCSCGIMSSRDCDNAIFRRSVPPASIRSLPSIMKGSLDIHHVLQLRQHRCHPARFCGQRPMAGVPPPEKFIARIILVVC